MMDLKIILNIQKIIFTFFKFQNGFRDIAEIILDYYLPYLEVEASHTTDFYSENIFIGFECPFCFTRYSKNGNPFRGARQKIHFVQISNTSPHQILKNIFNIHIAFLISFYLCYYGPSDDVLISRPTFHDNIFPSTKFGGVRIKKSSSLRFRNILVSDLPRVSLN